MAEPFDQRYPNIAAWVQHGWIELGRDDFSRTCIRVFDIGGLIWEGFERYDSVEEALREAEAAIAAWIDENR